MIQLHRIHAAAYDALDTTGTYLYEGRWHTRGARVIYTAQHISLAALEVLVHAGGRKFPPKVFTRIHLPDSIAIEKTILPSELSTSQRFCDRWLAEARTPVLQVPSAAVNGLEWNFLLNPAHPDLRSIKHDKPIPFPFDPRLIPAR